MNITLDISIKYNRGKRKQIPQMYIILFVTGLSSYLSAVKQNKSGDNI